MEIVLLPLILVFLFSGFSMFSQRRTLIASGALLFFIASMLAIFSKTSSELLLLDPLAKLFIFVLGIIGPITLLYSTRYIRWDEQRYFVLTFLFIAAMYAFVISNHLLLTFIAWELMSICSFLLISFDYRNPRAISAANKCLILTQIGSLCFFFAIVLVWANFDTLLISHLSTMNAVIGLLLIIAALSKSSIFPFNWLPDAMKAPSPTSALLHSATMVCAGLFLLVRFAQFVQPFAPIIALLASVTLIYASVSALVELELKRIFAFSTLVNLSYMFLTLAFFNPLGEAAALFHFLNHALFKSALFFAVGILIYNFKTHKLNELVGAVNSLGKLKYAFVLLCIAAMGVPPMNSFLSKWAIYDAWITNFPIGIILIAFGTVTAIVYFSRVIGVLFSSPSKSPVMYFEFKFSLVFPLLLCILFGVTTYAYSIFIDPIVHPHLVLHVNISLWILIGVILAGLVFVPSVTVDKTGPFTGGEKLYPKYSERIMFSLDVQSVASKLNINRLYPPLSKIEKVLEKLSDYEYTTTKNFIVWTLIVLIIVYMVLLWKSYL